MVLALNCLTGLSATPTMQHRTPMIFILKLALRVPSPSNRRTRLVARRKVRLRSMGFFISQRTHSARTSRGPAIQLGAKGGTLSPSQSASGQAERINGASLFDRLTFNPYTIARGIKPRKFRGLTLSLIHI